MLFSLSAVSPFAGLPGRTAPPPDARGIMPILGSDRHFAASWECTAEEARRLKGQLAAQIASHATDLTPADIQARQADAVRRDRGARLTRNLSVTMVTSVPLAVAAGVAAIFGLAVAGPAGALLAPVLVCAIAALPLAAVALALLKLDRKHLSHAPELTRRVPVDFKRHRRDNRMAYSAGSLAANAPLLCAGAAMAAASVAATTILSIASAALAPVTALIGSCTRVAVQEAMQTRVAGRALGIVRGADGKPVFDAKAFDAATAELKRPACIHAARSLGQFAGFAAAKLPETIHGLVSTPEGRRQIACYGAALAVNQVAPAVFGAIGAAAGLGSIAGVAARACAPVGTMPMASVRAAISAAPARLAQAGRTFGASPA